MNTHYALHTTETAPEEARPALEQTRQRLHMLPNLVAAMATSPHLLTTFLELSQFTHALTLTMLEREVVSMAIGAEIGCLHCVAVHTLTLQKMRTPEPLIRALKSGGPVENTRLAALRDFARAVVQERGAVPDALQDAFFAAAFTPAQALEVLLLHGMLAMSTYASRLMRVPLDDAFVALAS